MTVTVSVNLEKTFDVQCSQTKAFSQLVDVASTAAMFPKLDQIVNLGGDTWRWEMAKIGVAGISHQVKYTVKYTNDGRTKIDWSPLENDSEGNALVRGAG